MSKFNKFMEGLERVFFHLIFPTMQFFFAFALIADWVCNKTSFPWIALIAILGAVAAIARRD